MVVPLAGGGCGSRWGCGVEGVAQTAGLAFTHQQGCGVPAVGVSGADIGQRGITVSVCVVWPMFCTSETVQPICSPGSAGSSSVVSTVPSRQGVTVANRT